MILINLLPHREAAKKVRKENFIVSCMLAAMAGALVAGGIYLYFQNHISDQLNANAMIERENARIKTQILEVQAIESDIAALKARQQAVEDLQSQRNAPVELMNHVIRQVPNGSFINSLRKSDSQVAMTGMAQSNQTVSDLLRNIKHEMPWNTQPRLIETRSDSVTLTANNQRQVYGYSLTFSIDRRQQDAQPEAAD